MSWFSMLKLGWWVICEHDFLFNLYLTSSKKCLHIYYILFLKDAAPWWLQLWLWAVFMISWNYQLPAAHQHLWSLELCSWVTSWCCCCRWRETGLGSSLRSKLFRRTFQGSGSFLPWTPHLSSRMFIWRTEAVVGPLAPLKSFWIVKTSQICQLQQMKLTVSYVICIK